MGVDQIGLVALAAQTQTEPQWLTLGWWGGAVSFKSVQKIKRSSLFVKLFFPSMNICIYPCMPIQHKQMLLFFTDNS